MYNSPSSFSASEFLTSNALPHKPTILVGDFNLHSPNWDITVTEENNHSCCFCEWMANNNIVVLNDHDKLTMSTISSMPQSSISPLATPISPSPSTSPQSKSSLKTIMGEITTPFQSACNPSRTQTSPTTLTGGESQGAPSRKDG